MQQPQSADISDSKRKRRKRTDDQGRTFTCKCGKSYLSYPALYTHIKTKHADQPLSRIPRSQFGYDSPNGYPQRLQRSQTSRQKERIQKEKEKQKQKEKEREKQKQKQRQREREKQLQDNYPLYGNSLPQVNNIQVLREFLFKYFPNIVVHPGPNNKNQLTNIERKQLREMKEYWTNGAGRKKEDQTFTQVYETPIKFVLGKFVLELENQVQNYSMKKFLSFFALTIKRAVQKIREDENYFKVHNASELPLMLDTIMRDHLLVDNNDFLSNPTVAARMLYHFGRWLYVNKFTNQSLKYNF